MEISIQMTKVVPIGTITHSVSSVMFSVNSHTALFCTKECVQAIDNFFDDMQLEKTGNPWVPKVRLADAFSFFDTDNRFAYKGSLTLPPCNNNWLRDVCMTIYPIKQAHVDKFRKNQLGRNPSTKFSEDGKKGGNNRMIQEISDEHNVLVVTNEYSALTLLLLTICVVFLVSCMICFICCCCYCCKARKLKFQSQPITGKGAKVNPKANSP